MNTAALAAHGAVLAELNPHSADPLRDTALGICLSLGLVMFVGLALAAYGRQRYGGMLAAALGASVVLGAAAMPDVTMSVLTGLFGQTIGGQ